MVTELLLDWHDLFLTVEEQDRLTGWHLEVSLYIELLQCLSTPVTNITGRADAGQQLVW